jgi:hypothetical protein
MTKRDKSRDARIDQMANMAAFTKVFGTGRFSAAARVMQVSPVASRHPSMSYSSTSKRFWPSRHFAWAQQSGRFQVKTDTTWQAEPAPSVENDPERTLCLPTATW